jgi:tRNA threonylcarbamoyladenosine biosynthesis protein TsaB
MIISVLDMLGLILDDIDGFAIGIGPGSFTGLRVGLSIVKGLSFATNKPVMPVSTLDALAMNITFSPYLISPILDAKRGEIYTALYRWDKGIKKLTDDLLIKPDIFIRRIKEKVIFVGDGIRVYKDFIKERLSDLALFPPLNLINLRASNIGLLGMELLKNDIEYDVDSLSPRYLTPPPGEIKGGRT